ncbi:MAG: DUF4388 domain-containing protein [Sorangiineae bacterium]|nr:DUF4388 domain-containing protein [Polyangiaceae bacterium]MEB2322271.1 DUF4388 domain-containing protein [Sorangiineae bacterium]
MDDRQAELVRIDAQGQAHPIGRVASQRLRARAGEYRILPAPQHVILMRYTGADGRRDDEDGAVVRLAGEITAPGVMCDILALIAQSGWRGELAVLDGERARTVFFDQGNVVGAASNVEDERLGAVLYRYGALDEAALARVVAEVREGRRFGEAAVELGLLTQERIYEYIGKQIAEIVFATLTVGDGSFFFLDGFDEGRLVSRHTLGASLLLMDGVTRLDEVRYFREKIPSFEHIPARVEGHAPPADEFVETWMAIDGKRTVEELGRVTGAGEFETAKAVYALIQSKHVVIHPPRMTGGPAGVVAVANEVLRAVFRHADAVGRGDEVRSSLSSFAVGAGVYDLLFRGAGPDPSGALDAEVVARNLAVVAGTEDPENELKQMLSEYSGFALFSAGAVLGPEREGVLKREVAAVMSRLRPQA